jgi:hypothetical protein
LEKWTLGTVSAIPLHGNQGNPAKNKKQILMLYRFPCHANSNGNRHEGKQAEMSQNIFTRPRPDSDQKIYAHGVVNGSKGLGTPPPQKLADKSNQHPPNEELVHRHQSETFSLSLQQQATKANQHQNAQKIHMQAQQRDFLTKGYERSDRQHGSDRIPAI